MVVHYGTKDGMTYFHDNYVGYLKKAELEDYEKLEEMNVDYIYNPRKYCYLVNVLYHKKSSTGFLRTDVLKRWIIWWRESSYLKWKI